MGIRPAQHWFPPNPLDDFFMKPVPHTTLKVGSVHAPRPMPRARRSC